MLAQVFSGGSIGLLLGLLMGLSASPVVALVIGALAALLATLVLPQAKGTFGDVSPVRLKAAAARSTAMSCAAIFGIVIGLWLRTHDSLSPPTQTVKQQVDALKVAGYTEHEALRLVASREFPSANTLPFSAAVAASGAASANLTVQKAPVAGQPNAGANTKNTVLFSATAEACSDIDPTQYASSRAAIQGYKAHGHLRLARVADGLVKAISDEDQRIAALKVLTEELCAAK